VLPDPDFRGCARDLESAYLESDDPERQSGFSGGRTRWVVERSPLVEALHREGDFLDVGCANGLFAADVMTWARGRGVSIVAHGVDLGPRLIELARQRLPQFASNFHVADAWTWEPDRQWTYVYSLLDLSPRDLWCHWLRRLHSWVEPDGRLIIGSYGGRTPRRHPADVVGVMEGCGFSVAGSGEGGDPVVTRFAWTTRIPRALIDPVVPVP